MRPVSGPILFYRVSDPYGAFSNFGDPRFYTPGQPFGFRIGAQLRY